MFVLFLITLRVHQQKGSLIFFHIWRNPNKGTAGCTAVSGKNILKILKWIDVSKNPIILQLPKTVYNRLRSDFKLPKIK